MNIPEFIAELANKPTYFIIMANDSDLRRLYINRFCAAHNAKPKFVEKVEFKNKSRSLIKNEVLVLTDFDAVLEKHKPEFKTTDKTVLYVFTKIKTVKEDTAAFYHNRILTIADLTEQQADNILEKQGLDSAVIQFLNENAPNPSCIRLWGLQAIDLAQSLNMSHKECFDIYFKPHLKTDIDEEPTPFLNAILDSDYSFVFEYLESQRGNEFWVYAALFRWMEQLIRFVTCNRDYWNTGGLVKAVYSNFQNRGLERMPAVEWINLYHLGLAARERIKLTERDAMSGLEIFVCTIINKLVMNGITKPVTAVTAGDR